MRDEHNIFSGSISPPLKKKKRQLLKGVDVEDKDDGKVIDLSVSLEEMNIDAADSEEDEQKLLIERSENMDRKYKEISEDPDKINLQQMWKFSKKLWPKNSIFLPTAKRNHMGKIVTGPRDVRNVLAKEYKNRLRSRPVRPDLMKMKKRKKIIFEMKMKLAESTSTPDWQMKDIDRALSNLKNNKSRDFEGYINEIFKIGVIGVDLKKSLLLMFNKMKRKKLIHSFMNYANVNTVPKK
jgi:hypothetical protein